MNRPTYQIEMCTDGRHKVIVNFEDLSGSKAAIAAAQGIYSQLTNAPTATPTSADVGQAPDEDPPTCAVHHTPMALVQGRQGSFWSCHTKTTGGTWCSYKPNR